ncbi:MAG: small, acid-soluble spore protein, alpha/beta type [Eubacteriales bacterium]|nr:small, acid-soluble spore protein, alpha/beta type [Eubacteriales bacterium]
MNQKKITREDILMMEEKDRMKYEIAEELGLLDQVLEEGWKSLSSKETGRIGGLMTKRRQKTGESSR